MKEIHVSSTDFTKDTAELTSDERTIYMEMLKHYWQRGFIPSKPRKIMKLLAKMQIKISMRSWLKTWHKIEHLFEVDGDYLIALHCHEHNSNLFYAADFSEERAAKLMETSEFDLHVEVNGAGAETMLPPGIAH